MMGTEPLSGRDLALILDIVGAEWLGQHNYAALLLHGMGPARATASAVAVLSHLLEITAEAAHMSREDALAMIRQAVELS